MGQTHRVEGPERSVAEQARRTRLRNTQMGAARPLRRLRFVWVLIAYARLRRRTLRPQEQDTKVLLQKRMNANNRSTSPFDNLRRIFV